MVKRCVDILALNPDGCRLSDPTTCCRIWMVRVARSCMEKKEISPFSLKHISERKGNVSLSEFIVSAFVVVLVFDIELQKSMCVK